MKDFYSLPVYQHRTEILENLKDNQVIVVESPTGSGKTTQIPLILKEAGYCDDGMVGITQPRRIATLSVCDFIKTQLDDKNSYVGYKMRFDDTTKSDTRIKIMTDGILLMEIKSDPLLSAYNVIVVDEAHERSLNIDFILGLLKHILKQRPEFRVIISSATINTKVFSKFFDNCPVVSIKSRVYPVDIIYNPIRRSGRRDDNALSEAIIQIVKKRQGKGDILIFLPGEFDINQVAESLYRFDTKKRLEIYPLYSRLSKEEQEAVFTPTSKGKTKVVISTNIAETSLTIDGITCVIDLGIAKMNFYNQKNFTSSLVPLPVSRSSASQRKGRAGRTGPGVCYRLYTKKDFQSRSAFNTEEILRTDLSEVVLRMCDLKITDFEHFPFITKPKASALKAAEHSLRFIGAIDKERHLTKIGSMMVKFPLLPRHSRVVVEALVNRPDVTEKAIIAIAFLSCRSPFLFPSGMEDQARAAQKALADTEYGDFGTYIKLYRLYEKYEDIEEKKRFCTSFFLDFQGMQEIMHVTEQLSDIATEMDFVISDTGSMSEYLICIAAGMKQFICIRENRWEYKTLKADAIYVHPSSVFFRNLPDYMVAGEIMETSRLYARTVSPIKESWLEEIEPGLKKQLRESAGLAARPRKPEREQRAVRSRKQTSSVKVFGRTYPTVAIHRNQNVAVIPYEDLDDLATRYRKSAKQPRGFRATVQCGGYYVHYGQKFHRLLDLKGKLHTSSIIVSDPPSGHFTLKKSDELIGKLNVLLDFCKNKKFREQLCFIQLDCSKRSWFFSRNDDFYDALDTSLYALNLLKEQLYESGRKGEAKLVSKNIAHLIKLTL